MSIQAVKSSNNGTSFFTYRQPINLWITKSRKPLDIRKMQVKPTLRRTVVLAENISGNARKMPRTVEDARKRMKEADVRLGNVLLHCMTSVGIMTSKGIVSFAGEKSVRDVLSTGWNEHTKDMHEFQLNRFDEDIRKIESLIQEGGISPIGLIRKEMRLSKNAICGKIALKNALSAKIAIKIHGSDITATKRRLAAWDGKTGEDAEFAKRFWGSHIEFEGGRIQHLSEQLAGGVRMHGVYASLACELMAEAIIMVAEGEGISNIRDRLVEMAKSRVSEDAKPVSSMMF